jgi:hypothetical protein
MKNPFKQRLQSWSLIILLVSTMQQRAHAESALVRSVQGCVHGFLEISSEDGRVVASGDAVQVVHGDRVTSQTIFTFKDGSIDEETTVFSQHRTFQLISDHHVQKGPFFPHPMDVFVDARSGQVTIRSIGKDGKQEVKTVHLQLPPDLANGMVSLVVENMRADASATTVPMLVATPEPRVVKLVISNRGEDNFSLAGFPRKAVHHEIRIELGGIVGLAAPLIGEAPPNIQIWTMSGQAPTFVREQGPIYPDGPMMTIQLASPAWPDSPKSGE